MKNDFSRNGSTKTLWVPLKITITYLIVGGLWILLSDKLVELLVADPKIITRIAIVKGWFYVAATGLMLYTLISRAVSRIRGSQEETRATEAKYRELVESANSIILRRDVSGNVTFFNEFAQKFFGYTKEEILGQNVVGTIVPEMDRYGRDLKAMIEDIGKHPEEYANNENENMRRNGERAWIAWTNKPVRDEHGRITEILCIGNDITERKQAEEILRRFELLVAHSRDIIFFVQRDNGRILEANEAATKAYGYSREQFLTMTIHQLRAPETLDLVQDQMNEADLHGILLETVHHRKDGSAFPVEVSSRGETIGGTRTLISVVRDITERKRVEEALRISEERFRKIFEESPIGIAFLGKEREIFLTNQKYRDFLGYSEAEIHQLGPAGLLHPDDLAPSMDLSAKLRSGEIPVFHMEQRHIRKDGTVVWADTQITALRDADGQLIHTIAWVQDITNRKLAGAALQQSERNYREIFDNANDAIFIHDADTGAILDVNDSMLHLYGFGREETSRLTPQECSLGTSPYSAVEAGQWIAKAIAEGPQLFEWHARKKSGELFWVEVALKSANISGQRRLLAIVRDITERKRAEEALRESEERFRQLAEHINQVFWIANVDMTETLFVSPAYERIWGRTCASLYNRPKSWLDSVHPEDLPLIADKLAKRASDPQTFEYRIVRPDGTVRWIIDRGFPVRDKTGKIYRFAGIAEDITERKIAEEGLRASESKFRSYIESAPVAIFVANPEGNLIEFNPAAVDLLGYDASVLRGMNVLDLHPKEDREEVLSEFDALIKTGRLETERRMKKCNGETIWVSLHVVMTSDGVSLGYCQDITERREMEKERSLAEAQLRQVQKMEALGTLAGGIAHDFNNILGVIVGYSELADADAGDPIRVRSCLSEVLKGAGRAKDLVQQILAFSRRGEQKKKPLQVGLIIKETLKMLRASLPSTVEIKQNVASKAALMADPTQMHQVLMNLCTNAAHAMQDGGGVLEVSLVDVRLGAEAISPYIKPGPYVELTVKDTGHGIDPSILDHIFDPFFTTKEQGVGTGLGLSVVHGIVKSHGGAIEVDSQIDKGTAFHVFFPVIEAATELPISTTVSLPGGRERILVVDDEPALAKATMQMLERLGYQVEFQTNGVDALEAIRRQSDDHQYDLVITDMTMPRMTGVELARELLRLQPDTSILLCTGFSEKMDADTAKSLGIRGFLMKPVILKDLAHLVRKVLDKTN